MPGNTTGRCIVRLMVIVACCFPGSFAQGQPFEPGQLEARQTTRPATAPTVFTHPAVEVRGAWMTSRDMLQGRDAIAKQLDRLRDANFNTLLLDCWFRGYAGFPGSDVAPLYPQLEPDLFGWIVEQARARGLAVHAWPEYGFYAYHATDPDKDESRGPLLTKHPELTAVDAAGRAALVNPQFGAFYSLCPSNPKSHALLGQIIVDCLKRYPAVSGVNLDRIRYPDADYCFCEYCREHFRRDSGIELKRYVEGSPEARKLLDWRREQTAVAVQTIRSMIREVRPGLPITAYVVGPFEMDSKAQGWDLWAQRGLVEGLAVSMYGADIEPAARRAVELLGDKRGVLIGALNAGQKTDVFVGNVEIARRYAPLGQFTWYVGDVIDDVDGLRAGPYARPARSSIEPARPSIESPRSSIEPARASIQPPR